MTAVASKVAALADPLEVFQARCSARAYLYAEGELDLHEAVDGLQAAAVRSGLVAKLGQDHIQAIMAAAFRKVRRPYIVESVEAAAPPAPEPPQYRGAAPATVDALVHSLRERGVAALAERDTLRRLGELSTGQVRQVLARLIAMRPRYPAIDDELLLKLGRQL